MQIRYKTPITHEAAVKMLGKVRKELDRQKCSALVSKIVDPLCAVGFVLPLLMLALYFFNTKTTAVNIALASRIPKFTELSELAVVKVPALFPHGADNPAIIWVIIAIALPVALCFVVSLVIRLVYRPKSEHHDCGDGVAETARELYDSVHRMCLQDSAIASGKATSIALTAVLLITLAFEIYICSHVYPDVPKDELLGRIGTWGFCLVSTGLACLMGLGLTESITAGVCGVSNHYGASLIEKDCYEYLCSVDPDENAKRMGRTAAAAKIHGGEKLEGIDCVTKKLAGEYKCAMLCSLMENGRLSVEKLTAELAPCDEIELKKELEELVNDRLIARSLEKELDADILALTEAGSSLADMLSHLNIWGLNNMILN